MSNADQKSNFIMTYSWSDAGMIQDVGCGNYVELSALQCAHDDAARLESERAEQWRLRRDAEADRDTKAAVIAELRDQLGECKGEYDRAVNKVDALREQLAERDTLLRLLHAAAKEYADQAPCETSKAADAVRRLRSALSATAEQAKGSDA